MKNYLAILAILLCSVAVEAQEQFSTIIERDRSVPLQIGAPEGMEFTLPSLSTDKRIIEGHVKVTFDTGEEFVAVEGVEFEAKVTFDLKAFKAATPLDLFQKEGLELSIQQDGPEAYFVADISKLTEADGNDHDFAFDRLELTVTAITLPDGHYRDKIRLNFHSTIVLGLKTSTTTPKIIAAGPITDLPQQGRVHDITWEDSSPLDYYQLQVLRLYNTKEATAETENNITAQLDWNKAMSFEGKALQGDAAGQKYFRLSISEGTGIYALRVRAIGNYYPGGPADSRNWGTWSRYEADGTVIELNSASPLPYFFFKDPEEDKNWIYSRIFTENSRIKETISYADVLLNARQAQTYLPSQDVTLVTQTVLDHSGRPALTSIPVPLPGRAQGYREGFMKAKGKDTPYSAADFDTEANYLSPSPTAPFDYYTNNEDKSIPNAMGHGYTRTLFYNDALGRVREQSGVGETHKIGGKTTRYLYATASDDELIALFGDEAPTGESVVKTTTIDPNGVASVTYTSKEGNVIATALTTSDDNGNLDGLDEEGSINTLRVKDRIRTNIKIPEGFEASKRFSVARPDTLSLDYRMSCTEFEQLCQIATLDCKFSIRIELLRLDDQGEVESNNLLMEQELGAVPCTGVDGKQYKQVQGPNDIPLDPGVYLLRKRLFAGDPELATRDNSEEINKQVKPIANLVALWLESIENTIEQKDFYRSLLALSTALSDKKLGDFNNSPRQSTFPVVGLNQSFIDAVDGRKNDSDYSLTIFPADFDESTIAEGKQPSDFLLVTPCCPITIPIDWIPEPDLSVAEPEDGNDNDILSPVNTRLLVDPEAVDPPVKEFSPDFEGHMIAFFEECEIPGIMDKIYSEYMPGWEKKGTFNLMVYHMLNDKYRTGNKDNLEPQGTVQYQAEELLNCWNAQLSQLKDELCGQFDFDAAKGPLNISSAYDEKHSEANGEEKETHDNIFDKSFEKTFFLIKWLVKKKLSKKMRELQTDGGPSGENSIEPQPERFHLVKGFLECSGQKFAKIITPFDAEPLPSDVDTEGGFSYTRAIPKGKVPVQLNQMTYDDYFITAKPEGLAVPKETAHRYSYIPISDWDPKKYVSEEVFKVNEHDKLVSTGTYRYVATPESLFPYIKNPIYAFKYFEYTHVADPNYQLMEQNMCYADPNDCYRLDADGLILLKNGQPVKVPCCTSSTSPQWDSPGCYADTEYYNTITPDIVGYALNHEGTPAKLVVDDFCNNGRVRCPYTKEGWGAGERFYFYRLLQAYVIPNDPDWAKAPKFDLDCEDLNTPHEWFTYEGPLDEQQDKGYPDLAHEGTKALYPEAQYYYTRLTFPEDEGRVTFKYIELQIEEQLIACREGCEERRIDFEQELMAMLERRCYVIDGCRTEDCDTHNVIPKADIDLMVQGIVEACMSQCRLSTFACEVTQCRDADLPRTTLGSPTSSFNLDYGVGGFTDDFCEPNTTYAFEDDALCNDPDGDGILQCLTKDKVTKEPHLLSWYEYTKLQQVAHWDFEVDMPSRCAKTGPPDPDGFAGSVGEDGCASGDCPPSSPNSRKGSTFVDKSKYEVEKGNPLEVKRRFEDGPVHSPAIGINVTVQPENEK